MDYAFAPFQVSRMRLCGIKESPHSQTLTAGATYFLVKILSGCRCAKTRSVPRHRLRSIPKAEHEAKAEPEARAIVQLTDTVPASPCTTGELPLGIACIEAKTILCKGVCAQESETTHRDDDHNFLQHGFLLFSNYRDIRGET